MSGVSLLKNRFMWIVVAGVVLVAVAFTRHTDQATGVQRGPVAVPVEVTKVSAEPMVAAVSAVGTVSAMRDVNVSSETAGRVTKVLFQLGDNVRAGEPLVLVDDELKVVAVDQAKAQFQAAETNYKKAGRDFQRAETLFQSHDIADVELEGNRLAMHSAEAQFKGAQAALRAATRQLEDTRVKSPIAGIVASKRIEVGEMVAPGREIANIVDIAMVKVKVSIAEEDIAKVAAGQKAKLQIDSQPGKTFEGSVLAVGSKTESSTGHTYPVEVVVKNTKTHDLKVGMFARVEIATRTVKKAVTIPRESLVGDESNPKVFVVENAVAHLRPIKLGIRSADKYQVAEGLNEGEIIVSFGQRDLKDSTAVVVK
ncbi:MAG: efflux RND transporter periplasmic adaptor subunit [Bacteroidota bacterium]